MQIIRVLENFVLFASSKKTLKKVTSSCKIGSVPCVSELLTFDAKLQARELLDWTIPRNFMP